MSPDLTWYKLLAVGLIGGVAAVAVDVTEVIRGDSREMGTLTADVKNLTERFDSFEDRFDKFEVKVDGRFTKLENKIETRFNKLENKFETRFNKIEGKIDKILPIIYRLEQKLDSTYKQKN